MPDHRQKTHPLQAGGPTEQSRGTPTTPTAEANPLGAATCGRISDVSPGVPRHYASPTPPTWDELKAAVRRQDRDSLLVLAANITAKIARDEVPDFVSRRGITPWNIADVARTALAWSRFQRPTISDDDFQRLCLMDANISDDAQDSDPHHTEQFSRTLARLFFEQFSGQRSVLAEFARTILLYGSASEKPPVFDPEAMTPGWFESVTDGLTLDQYVESVFLISVGAQKSRGKFDPSWLDGPAFAELREVIDRDAVRRTFNEHLLADVKAFKRANRDFQDSLPAGLKRFAFNPLANTPFIEGVADVPIAPWVQAIIAKALPPAIYFLGWKALGDGFTHDLGHVFQHYVGRQLRLVEGERTVIPEAAYGTRRNRKDSNDWFLDLPGLLVLIECKARQPIESLRTASEDWLRSVEESIGKGIKQLNRSNRDLGAIATVENRIDEAKPRIGLVVTLEPFYLNQNWLIREHLPTADLPVGVISISELESLVRLPAANLADALLEAADAAPPLRVPNVLLLARALAIPIEAENRLLVDTWESVGLFRRLEGTGAVRTTK